MRKYVISYDAHTKEALEKEQEEKFDCKNLDDDFKNILIDVLCSFKTINSIDWVNNTTITFITNSDDLIINDVAEKIDDLGYCVDYHISLIHVYAKSGNFVEKSVIRQKNSVSNFKDLVKERCERLK